MTDPGLASPARTEPARSRAAAWMATGAVLVFHGRLLDGGVPAGFDVVNEKLFWRAWTFDRLRRGELPLWNPHVLAGYPMHADPVQALFYPLEWIHLVLPHPLAIGVSFTLAALIACWGTMRLARVLGADEWGGALAGVAYAMGGLVAGHVGLGEIPHLQAMGWTPWCVALALESLAGRTRSVRWLPLVIALAVLAGHVQYGYQTLVAVAITSVAALAWMTPRPAVARALFSRVAPAVTLGLTIASVSLVPALAYVSHSNRGGGLDWMASTTGAIHPFELLRLLIPDFFGDAVTSPYWGGFLKEMSTPYLGIATLAVLPWALGPRFRRATLVIAPMAIFGFLTALSAYTPFHRWIFHLLPGFAFFRMPVRWLHLATLGVAVAAALGVTALRSRPARTRPPLRDGARAALVPVAIAIVGALFFLPVGRAGGERFAAFEARLRSEVDSFLGPEPDESVPGWRAAEPARYATAREATARAMLFALASSGALLALGRRPTSIGPAALVLVSIDLVTSGQRYVSTVPRDTLETASPLAELLASEPEARTLTLLPGTVVPRPPAFEASYPGFNRFSQSYIHRAMVEGRRDVGGVFFVVSSRYRALAGVTSSFEHETVEDAAILDLLGVRWVMAPADGWPSEHLAEAAFVSRAGSGGIRVLENLHAGPRVFLARSVEIVDGPEQARARLVAPDFPSRAVVLAAGDVEGSALAPASLASLGSPDGTARITEERDERVAIEVDAARPTLLLVADAYDAGWRASVDGATVPVIRADVALRAVPVPAGGHQVVLRYRPRPLLIGAALSALAVLAWASLVVRASGAKRTSP